MNKQNYKQKIRKKLLSTAVWLMLIAAVFVCLFVTVQILSKGHVDIGGYSCFRVITGSMYPTIVPGELILTEQTDIQQIRINDIVCFRSESPDMMGETVTHRVVDIVGSETDEIRLLTKGDANLSMDGYFVTAQNLLGKVIWRSGDGLFADIVGFLTGQFGFLACIVFPAVLIAALILRDNVKSMKKDIGEVIQQLEEEQLQQPPQETLSEEEYQQLCDKIRTELIEEMKQSDRSEHAEQGE